MAKDLATLCSERHYMGSSSSGRYATDRSLRPSYERLPDPAVRMRGVKTRAAHHTRYLREQNVVGWVLACEQAKAELARCEKVMNNLQALLATLPAPDPTTAGGACAAAEGTAVPQDTAAEPPARSADGTDRAAVERAVAQVRARLDRALTRRKDASRQLRLIGISPKAQARIFAEVKQRSATVG